MKNETLKFKAEDFGLAPEANFNDVEAITAQPVINNKILFAGFSSDTTVVRATVDAPFTFTSKHAELYLAQLYATAIDFESITETRTTIEDDFLTTKVYLNLKNIANFPRKDWLDYIATVWGLESNTLRNSGWGFCYLGDETFDPAMGQTPSQRYLDVARFFGFMEAIATDESLVALRAINARAKSGQGYNSPRTGKFVHEYKYVRFAKGKYCSPYKLEKMIWATKEKAQTKHGVNISFEQAFEAIGVTKNTSKAATVATYGKLGLHRDFGESKSYRHARDTMVLYYQAKARAKASGKRVFQLKGWDKVSAYGYRTDGSYTLTVNEGKEGVDYFSNDLRLAVMRVPTYLDKEDFVYPDGSLNYSLSTIKVEDFNKLAWDELHGEFSRVVSTGIKLGIEYKTVQTVYGTKTTLITELGDIQGSSFKEAYKTYQRRLYAEKLATLDVDIIAPTSNALLYLNDSYDAGNCYAGTEAMAKRLGITDRKVIGIPTLWELAQARGESDNTLLQNAIKFAILKAWEVA